MLSFWIPGLEPAWVMGLFAVGFAVLGVISYFAALSRSEQEPDAVTAAVLYLLGFGILAVSEVVSMAEAAWGWSAASLFAISGSTVTVVAVIITAVALVAILAAAIIELREEQVYRAQHVHGFVR